MTTTKDVVKGIGIGFAVCLWVSGVVAALVAPVVIVEQLLNNRSCNNYQAVTGRATKFIWFDTCYIQSAARWERYDEYKARAIASEGLRNESCD